MERHAPFERRDPYPPADHESLGEPDGQLASQTQRADARSKGQTLRRDRGGSADQDHEGEEALHHLGVKIAEAELRRPAPR